MAQRIYFISDTKGDNVSLVRASTKVGALRHIAEKQFNISVANQNDLVWAIKNGVEIEEADEPVKAEA